LSHPLRGRKWAEFSYRIRTDPQFALESFNAIGTTKPEREITGKMIFIRMYGLPPGAVCPPELQGFAAALAGEEPEEPKPILKLVR
jgi:hypothetical protein